MIRSAFVELLLVATISPYRRISRLRPCPSASTRLARFPNLRGLDKVAEVEFPLLAETKSLAMKHFLLLLTLTCTPAFAAEPALVVPALARPTATPVEEDPLYAKYDSAWVRFDEAVSKATADVIKAIDSQFEKAADAGNLELAEMWSEKKKFFLDTKTLQWPSDGKAKVEWRRTNPQVEFPDDFSETVSSAQQAYAAAVVALKGDYETLVKEYTKARSFERAKRVKEEMAVLDKKPAVPPAPPKVVEEKPAAKAQRTPADNLARPFLDKMLKAIVANDYDGFVADTSDSYKATLTKPIVAGLSERFASRLKGGYEVTFLTELKQGGQKAYLWKLTFKDGGDDLSAKLWLKDGKVFGSFWQ